ncbi:MAG: HEAT repeat domain-containing protein, partial [Bacteroidetes bacterium]
MKLNKPLFPAFLLLILLPFACVPPSNEVPVDVRIDFSKKQQQKVYDYQDQGQTDSLIAYFHNQDPTLRYLAVSAFASIKDSTAVDSIVPLLNDRVEDVRIAAAYALGQIGHASAERHLINAFQRYDTAGVARNFNAAILEAVGKCGSKNSLGSLAGISTYTPKDTVLLTGQAWGIYRFALRGITSPEGTALMVKYATNHQYPAQVRFVAANYLMRARNIDLSGADNELAPAIARE